MSQTTTYPPLTAYRIHLSDGTNYATNCAAGITLEEAHAYFVGEDFEQSDGSKLRAVRVEQISPEPQTMTTAELIANQMPTPSATAESIRRQVQELQEVQALGFETVEQCREHQEWLDSQAAQREQMRAARNP